MLQKQNLYDFRKELLKVHKKGVRVHSRRPRQDEFEIQKGIQIVLPEVESAIIETAAKDFVDYLFVSMEVPAMLSYSCEDGEPAIRLSLSRDLGEANGYMGYAIVTDANGITVAGYDERGVAQALYFLEDLMNLRKAPFITYGTQKRKSLFDLRLTQSPFGMFEYPNEALALIAHRGYNAIELWIKNEYTSLRGDFLDVHLLCERAERYGISVYIQWHTLHSMHPDDEGAQEFYDNLYGKIFKECPKLAGITLVGEANEFQSRDPKVGKTPQSANYIENIPTGKIPPGWYPCCDFPDLVSMIQRSIRKAKQNADLVVVTYNWGHRCEEDRIKLIENLPEGVSLMPTWDMFEKFRVGDSVLNVADYTLRLPGPGSYFVSEAIAAKKRGIRLYANAQTSGRTWDFGVIPYEPMPGQWIKRFEAMQKAHEEWGLTGVLENIHYGFQPSIIGDLEKWAFFTPTKPMREIWNELLVRDFEDDAEAAGLAMDYFSEAITHYSITSEDQYGAFRVGPLYPLWVQKPPGTGKRPVQRRAMYGEWIYTAEYNGRFNDAISPTGVRIFDELKELACMRELLQKGIEVLEGCQSPNENLLLLLNLARFMHNTTVTGIHNKELYILKQKLHIAGTKENFDALLDELEALLRRERENVENTIPLVQVDSRLGWEPSMEYATDEEGLRWKLRQLDYELNITIPNGHKGNNVIDLFPAE